MRCVIVYNRLSCSDHEMVDTSSTIVWRANQESDNVWFSGAVGQTGPIDRPFVFDYSFFNDDKTFYPGRSYSVEQAKKMLVLLFAARKENRAVPGQKYVYPPFPPNCEPVFTHHVMKGQMTLYYDIVYTVTE